MHHFGPWAKLVRAREQIESLQGDSQRFFQRNRYGVLVGELNRQTGMYELRVGETPDIPSLWAVRVGEIVHDLRSALDGLVCQLAIHSNPGTDWRICEQRRTGFPIFIDGPDSSARPRFSRKALSYLLPTLITRIERLQPYKRGNGHRSSPLWVLHEMSNADKHRVIPIVAGRLLGTLLTPTDWWDIQSAHMKARVWLKSGAKIGEVYPRPPERHVYVYVSLVPEIAFGEGCDTVERRPVIPTLVGIANHAQKIIESFTGEFS